MNVVIDGFQGTKIKRTSEGFNAHSILKLLVSLNCLVGQMRLLGNRSRKKSILYRL